MTNTDKLSQIIRQVVREELEYTKKQIVNEILLKTSGTQTSNIRESSPSTSMLNNYSKNIPKAVEKPIGAISSNFFEQLSMAKMNDPDFIAQKMAS
jgi:hypothetical protein